MTLNKVESVDNLRINDANKNAKSAINSWKSWLSH